MPLGVVIERRELDNPWQQWSWRPVAVVPGAPPLETWRELLRGDRFVRWLAGSLPLELHRTETEAYRANLAGNAPAIYVVLRKTKPSDATAGNAFKPFLVTASPYEAESYLESGDEIVEGVPMPPSLIGWLQEFVARHPVEQAFVKRKRKGPKAAAPPGDGPDRFAGVPPVRQRGRNGRS